MNKRELVEAVSRRLGFLETKSQAAQAVEAVLECIAEGAQREGKVSLNNFGAFKTRERSARRGVNPSTGDPITIPAMRTLTFTVSPALRQRLTETDAPAHNGQPGAPTHNGQAPHAAARAAR